jgi:hypothetical protein
MREREEEIGSLERAALRIAWASRALNGASEDLYVAGATAAAEVIGEEADQIGRLAEEVRKLERVATAEQPAPGVVF